jgi:hypothetical protein
VWPPGRTARAERRTPAGRPGARRPRRHQRPNTSEPGRQPQTTWYAKTRRAYY